MQLTGLHHVTAVTADPRANHEFYTSLLGLRLVKKTVNQDDTGAYHLFYADGLASPGSDLTFFHWEVPPERHGTHSVARTALRVAGEASLRWWADRFDAAGVTRRTVQERGGRLVLDFEDNEGQRLSLVDDGGKGENHPWAQSPVPVDHQIHGLGPVTLSVPGLLSTDVVLTQVMGMRCEGRYHEDVAETHVYAMGEGGPHAEVHVRVEPEADPVQPGAGGVHHVAFRTPNQQEYLGWAERLRSLRIPNSGPVDRFYFESLYFREPNGILFEIATDGPGFATDEPLEHLGERLSLPPFLEPRRAQIEAGLAPL